MGFLDKVKSQAAQAAEKAQEGLKAGQAKLEDVQSKKRADALLRDLGANLYAERAGRGSEETAAEIERLMKELAAYEAEHGPLAAPHLTAAAPAAEGSPPDGEAPAGGGSFTLDDV